MELDTHLVQDQLLVLLVRRVAQLLPQRVCAQYYALLENIQQMAYACLAYQAITRLRLVLVRVLCVLLARRVRQTLHSAIKDLRLVRAALLGFTRIKVVIHAQFAIQDFTRSLVPKPVHNAALVHTRIIMALRRAKRVQAAMSLAQEAQYAPSARLARTLLRVCKAV